MAIPSHISIELKGCQQNSVRISYTEFHPRRPWSVEGTDRSMYVREWSMAFVVTVFTKAHNRTISVDVSCAEFTPLTEVWLSLHRFLLNAYLPNGITWTFPAPQLTHIVKEIIEHMCGNSFTNDCAWSDFNEMRVCRRAFWGGGKKKLTNFREPTIVYWH